MRLNHLGETMTAQSLSQTPDPLNLILRQNQNWTIGFSYTDSQGNPLNVTGYTPLLQFRTSALAKTTALALTTSNGITFNPTTTPQVQIAAEVNVAPGKYEWDLVLQGSTGNLYLGCGTVQVNAEVSR
jgi:hypothetical protein